MTRAKWTVTAAIVFLGSATAWTQQAVDSAASAEAVRQARQYFLQAREGHFEVVPRAVALVEAAVAADPDNVALANALSFAYSLQVVAATQPGGNMADGMTAGQKAFTAAQRAVRLGPNDADALAMSGGMLGQYAALQKNQPMLTQAIAQIYRAVALAPEALTPRLVRSVFGLTQPADVRDLPALIDDLSVLAAAAEGTRAGDMEHLLLGDLYAESGKPEEARRQYIAAGRRPASGVKDLSQSRLAALDGAGVPQKEIAALRGRIGDCVMCHAK
jgi:hypothetical protein